MSVQIQDDQASEASHGKLFPYLAIGACLLAIIVVAVASWVMYLPNQASTKVTHTQLEQNAGDLQVLSTMLCGSSSTQITTANGVFNITPSVRDIMDNAMHITNNSALQIAYDDDKTVHLVGPINPHEPIMGCTR